MDLNIVGTVSGTRKRECSDAKRVDKGKTDSKRLATMKMNYQNGHKSLQGLGREMYAFRGSPTCC